MGRRQIVQLEALRNNRFEPMMQIRIHGRRMKSVRWDKGVLGNSFWSLSWVEVNSSGVRDGDVVISSWSILWSSNEGLSTVVGVV